jgi:hypothetical protein
MVDWPVDIEIPRWRPRGRAETLVTGGIEFTFRCHHVLAVCGVASIGLVSAAQASENEKVLICHGTASEKNPYVVISVDVHAVEGHFDGSLPGHGQNNNPDVMLGADGTCPGDGDGDE